MKADTATARFGARLREAVGLRYGRGGVSAFAREMEARGVRGSSRGMVQHYLRGDHAPPLDFVEEAAGLLKVSFAWLATGEGEGPSADPVVSLREAFAAFEAIRAEMRHRLAARAP